jgi:diguanylate cyclase (GGDEF)-like protein
MDLNLVKFENLLQELKQDKSLEKNLSIIIRAIELEFQFQSLGLFLDSPKEKAFRLKIGRNVSHTFSKQAVYNYTNPLITDLHDLQNKHYYDPQIQKMESDFSHLIIIPLHNNNQLFGFLYMDKTDGHFSPEEVTKLNIFTSIISLGINLNDLRTMLEQIKVLDDVTQLFAYPSFIERASFLFSLMKRHKKNLIMVVFKVNNFEEILRLHGKVKINQAAKRVGEILQENLRSSDIAGKIFRDTIAIIMPETDLTGAMRVIQRIDVLICDLEIMDKEKIGWGIAMIQNSLKDVHQLLHNAEEAAFEANRNYDKNIIVYSEE